jgi:hypothetical protein
MRFILGEVSARVGATWEKRVLQVCRKPGDLVAQTLGCNDGYLIADALVGLEIKGQFGIIAFDYDFCRFLDGLDEASAPSFTNTMTLSEKCAYFTRESERL